MVELVLGEVLEDVDAPQGLEERVARALRVGPDQLLARRGVDCSQQQRSASDNQLQTTAG